MSNTFYTTAKGNNAEDAFDNAVKEARVNCKETLGASGTIAEKEEFIIFEGFVSYDPDGVRVKAEKIMSANNANLKDGYGPAGCISIGEGEYLFFGTSFSSD